jgi:hypothetical protein
LAAHYSSERSGSRGGLDGKIDTFRMASIDEIQFERDYFWAIAFPSDWELSQREVFCRLEIAESEISKLKNPSSCDWMNPAQIEEYSRGKYPAKLVRTKIQQAIDRPEDSPLQVGEHYTLDTNDRGRAILVNYPEFDRLMIAVMRQSVFF